MSLSTERYVSVFLDSTGEAQGTVWILVSSCGLEIWGGWHSSVFPSRALGMLSCYNQEAGGPDMQKAWKGCLLLFVSFVTGLGRLLPAQ